YLEKMRGSSARCSDTADRSSNRPQHPIPHLFGFFWLRCTHYATTFLFFFLPQERYSSVFSSIIYGSLYTFFELLIFFWRNGIDSPGWRGGKGNFFRKIIH